MGHWHADNELSTLQLKWKIEKVDENGDERERGQRGSGRNVCPQVHICIFTAAGSSQYSSELFKGVWVRPRGSDLESGHPSERLTLVMSLSTLVELIYCYKWSEQAQEIDSAQKWIQNKLHRLKFLFNYPCLLATAVVIVFSTCPWPGLHCQPAVYTEYTILFNQLLLENEYAEAEILRRVIPLLNPWGYTTNMGHLL